MQPPVYYTIPANPIPWINLMTVLSNSQFKKFVTEIEAIICEHHLNIDGRLKNIALSNKNETEKAVKKIGDLQHPVFNKTIKDVNYRLAYSIFDYYHCVKYGFCQPL
jgi:hypothetical protein